MPLVYDLSRLSARISHPTPNGIDRIDLAYAEHYLRRGESMLLFGLLGPRLCRPDVAASIVEAARSRWAGSDQPPRALAEKLWAALRGERILPRRIVLERMWTAAAAQRSYRTIASVGLAAGDRPGHHVPRDAVYLITTHFPLEWRSHRAWLGARPDVSLVAFVHDVLPTTHPHLFWRGEPARHLERLRFMARRAAGAVVTSRSAEAALGEVMWSLGRRDLPIHRAPPLLDPLFSDQGSRDGEASAMCPYFVVCGTLEPRKNHLFIVALWCVLARLHGPAAPRLVIVGKRGWRCRAILDALGDTALNGLVVEVNGLSTRDYRRLLTGARALLAPSLDEGFGLPVAEAIAVGVPALASDIPAHREQRGAILLPLDRDVWLRAIEAHAGEPGLGGPARRPDPRDRTAEYFAELDRFLSGFTGQAPRPSPQARPTC